MSDGWAFLVGYRYCIWMAWVVTAIGKGIHSDHICVPDLYGLGWL